MSETTYNAAEYYRFSHADDKNIESESITNQRRLLKNFIDNQPDITSVSEWVDDGVSGILFDRPAFKQMMSEIENGRINCIIVKDLSRFGREYIETGRYLRRVLPAYGVRFIAVNDNIDTIRDSGDDLIVSIKTVMNDAYCRDISVKTRTALKVKRESGDYVGACPIYGYKKADDNHNRLIIDEYPASVVRDIFRMKIGGMSALKIAEELNRLGVLSPLEYKKDSGLPHPKGGYADKDGSKWCANTILRILSNETYTGTLIQGRQGTHNYKIKDLIDLPKSEWVRTENAHEAIVATEDFHLVERISRLDTRSAPGTKEVYLFSGMLICGCCGARMTRKAVPYKGEKYHYYYCPTTKKRGCENAPMLKEDVLHEHVCDCVKAQISNVASIDSILASSDGKRTENAIAAQYLNQIAENECTLAKLTRFKSTLYENMVNGIIEKDEYSKLKMQYSDDEAVLLSAIGSLRQQHSDLLDGKSERLRWTEHFRRFEGLEELDRRAVVCLIKSIRVVSKTQLHITFNYQSEYVDICKLLMKEAA